MITLLTTVQYSSFKKQLSLIKYKKFNKMVVKRVIVLEIILTSIRGRGGRKLKHQPIFLGFWFEGGGGVVKPKSSVNEYCVLNV